MNRRGILGLLGGVAIAGPNVTKEAVAKALGGGTPRPLPYGAYPGQVELTRADRLRFRAEDQVRFLRHRSRLEQEVGPNGYGMSYKIRSKRSWGEAFKMSEHVKEQMEWAEIEAKLREEGAAERLLRALGIDMGDLE